MEQFLPQPRELLGPGGKGIENLVRLASHLAAERAYGDLASVVCGWTALMTLALCDILSPPVSF